MNLLFTILHRLVDFAGVCVILIVLLSIATIGVMDRTVPAAEVEE